MKPEDLYLYYGSIEGVEYVHTYWNILKVSVKKENKTEQQIREELIQIIQSEEYQEMNKLVRNPPPMDIEEI
tara:strand:+ start:864 stop:1079 length:216 start_codon:yes stop_codon:yes gene_type:complete